MAALTNVANADLVCDVFVGSYLKLQVISISNISALITSGLTVKIFNLFITTNNIYNFDNILV